jgi:iron complex transport system ATP-binding protein
VQAVVTQGRYAHQPGLTRVRPSDASAVAEALAVTRADTLAGRFFNELSYGEQRRVLLARALATGAHTLLLDEPTASLDINHTLSLFSLLRSLASAGHCIVAVLHNLDEARRFADRALLLHDGRTVAYGQVHEVISAPHVATVYGVRLIEHDALGFRLDVEPRR